MSGWENGMRGTILVQQDGTGGRSLTLPANGNAPTGFALSSGAYVTDQIDVLYLGSVFYFRKTATYPVLVDADASAFFARASIADSGQQDAINKLVLDLKGAGIWSKLDAAYPFVGGNGTAHSKNLLADSRHITWSGTLTHDANGVTGDGSTGRGLADFAFSDRAGSQNDAFLYVYCRTTTPTANGSFIAATTGTGGARAGLRAASASVFATDGLHSSGLADTSWATGSDYRNHLAGRRSASNAIAIFFGAAKGTNTTASVGVSDKDFGILARHSGSGVFDQYSNANLAFVAIGQALDDTEYAEFRAIIDTYQTALSRANP
jgi:hypothetical protein